MNRRCGGRARCWSGIASASRRFASRIAATSSPPLLLSRWRAGDAVRRCGGFHFYLTLARQRLSCRSIRQR
jgi:hypothetical protein